MATSMLLKITALGADDMSVQRVANKNCRGAVANREEFIGSNLEAYDTASTTGTDLYVVQSYGAHFPMYIAEAHKGKVNWYGNKDKYSVSTSKQMTQANPHAANMMWFDTESMLVLAKHGITGLAGGKS
jgi:hypothetical protein